MTSSGPSRHEPCRGGGRSTSAPGQRGRIARFRRDGRGVVAVEYALLAIPFTTALFFFIELTFDFFVQTSLDFAVDAAARRMQRGDVVTVPRTSDDFASSLLCPVLSSFVTCSNLVITMQVVSDWKTDPNLAPPIHDGILDPSAATYCFGSPTEPMLLQVVYPAPAFIMRLFRQTVSYSAGGRTSNVLPIIGNAAFVYEPGTQYGGTTCD